MKNRKKGAGVLLAALGMLCALTACHSYSGAADGSSAAARPGGPLQAPQKEADKAAGVQIMPGLTEDQPQLVDMSPEQLGKMGEPAGAMDVQNGKAVANALVYTIREATMFEDFEAAGIKPDEMEFLLTEEGMTDGNGKVAAEVKFLLIELTVQNVCADPERNITDMRLLGAAAASSGSENAGLRFFEVFPSEPAYFSNPAGKRIGDDWKEYYDYKLPVGQTKNLKIGWYIDTRQYDEKNLYLTFGYEEYQRYIKLEFQERYVCCGIQ